MAPVGINHLCVAVCLTAVIITCNLPVSFGDQALDCCLEVGKHPIPKQILNGYREQVKGEGCNISAVVFSTWKGKYLCTPSNSDWVNELKNWVDKLLLQCKKNGFKGKRCQAMKSKLA
ncbi:C-C motif chemokine 19-like [Hoplias malabaricus]|uniref:C-C motif chemokine 19-like n=1 Tax=Hoplias malabaricus TaxID=27720 RepID=UPI0034631119